MLVPVYDERGENVVGRLERAAPVCGKDFCDTCGDCLHCYDEFPCVRDGVHWWIYYINELSPEDQAQVQRS